MFEKENRVIKGQNEMERNPKILNIADEYEKEILLTISFLTNGKKDELRKCLESLQLILEAVPSELIVVDTGCDEEHLNIVKEFTNQIVTFKWCDDFARARNAGLDLAKGKWFLFLDDDEWFEDMSEIIEFFTSEEYKKYHTGNYKVRNYTNFEGTTWEDVLVTRMFELTPGQRFIYPIHETICRAELPIKYFYSTYVHHYGYVFKNKIEYYNHYRRNVTMLQNEYKKNPQNMRVCEHLFQEYAGAQEWTILCNTAEKVIFDDAIDKKAWKLETNVVFAYYMISLRRLKDNEKAKKFMAFLKNQSCLTETTKAYLAGCMLECMVEEEEYDKAVSYGQDYFVIVGRYFSDPHKYDKYARLILQSTFQKEFFQNQQQLYIMALLKSEQYANLKKWVSWMEKYEKTIDVNNELYILMMQAMMKTEKEDGLKYLLDDIVKNRIDGQMFIDFIIPSLIKAKKEKRSNLLSYFEDFNMLDTANSRLLYMLCENEKETALKTDIAEAFHAYIARESNIFVAIALWDLEKVMLKNDISMEMVLDWIDSRKWITSVDGWLDFPEREAYSEIEKEFLDCQSDLLLKKYFEVKDEEKKFLTTYESMKLNDLENTFQECLEQETDLYGAIYSQDVIEPILGFLPIQFGMMLSMGKVVEKHLSEKSKFQYTDAFRMIKETILKYPEYANFLNYYSKLLVEEFEQKEKDKKKAAAQQEMFELAEKIKQQVRGFVERGEIKKAVSLLKELKKYVPEDSEVEQMLIMLDEKNI